MPIESAKGKRMETTMEHSASMKFDQDSIWNGAAGAAWVEMQPVLDAMLRPAEDALVEAVWAEAPQRVLDVGCGTGSTTLAVQPMLGRDGRCTGIDISEPMLAAARQRAANEGSQAEFLRLDAQCETLEAAAYDMIVSRFGVMFFDDPVRAFRNLAQAVRPGGAMRFVAWRGPGENMFMTTAERAAAPLLPGLPPRDPDGPGQFAFADPDRVRRILGDSGWTQVAVHPADFACTLPARELDRYSTRMGLLGLVFPQLDERTQAEVRSRVAAAFEPFVEGTEVRFTAACWVVDARAPAASA